MVGSLAGDLLDDEDPFEVDEQAAHRFKHPALGFEDPCHVPPDRLLRRGGSPCRPLSGGPMTKKQMTRAEEHEFYAKLENQEPEGPARRRKRSNLTKMVPVRFPPETLEEVRRLAGADDRSVSSGIRRGVEHELNQQAG
jgi:hypothetical protein